MRIWSRIMVLSLAALAFACGEPRPATPVETFKTYTKAARNKDYTTMKLLLSNATLKMHEDQAKAQGMSIDDIIKRETLLGENQRTVEYRNEKINGEHATLEFRNQYGGWEQLPFIHEDGVWKIDKQGYADQIIKEIERQQKQAFGDVDVPDNGDSVPGDGFDTGGAGTASTPVTAITPMPAGSPEGAGSGMAGEASPSPTPQE